MSIKDARPGVPVDWSDPEEASLQAKIDVLRNMIGGNPMTYSEKDKLVRQRMAGKTICDRNKQSKKDKKPDWAI